MKIFYLPDLGEGLAEAEIREWYVKVGDTVKVDQPLVSMETAKAIVDVPSPYAGKIHELHGDVNSIIKTGAPFITFDIEDATHDAPKAKGSVVGSLEESAHQWQEGNMIIGSAQKSSNQIKVMPAARMLAKQFNIDLAHVKATGPQGLITVDDVKKCMHASEPKTSTAIFQDGEALHGVRRVMAQAMMQSHREIVPVTIIEDADITDLPAKSDLTVKILQAIVAACTLEPALNAWFDSNTLQRKLFSDVHVGLALDSDEGLFVPVLKNVAHTSVDDLRQQIDAYKVAVRNRSIPAKDMQGATITLSNFGTIAGRYATPIIVPPCVAILGCGRLRATPIVRDGKVVPGMMLPLSLTFDHRAVTGGEATRFLHAVIKAIK